MKQLKNALLIWGAAVLAPVCSATITSYGAGNITDAANPAGYDPRYHYRLAIEAGCNAYAAPLGFIEAGADQISLHQEACPNLDRTLRMIQSEGARAGDVDLWAEVASVPHEHEMVVTSTDGAVTYADASRAGDLGVVSVAVGEEFVAPTSESAAAVVENSPAVEGRGEEFAGQQFVAGAVDRLHESAREFTRFQACRDGVAKGAVCGGAGYFGPVRYFTIR
mgnify:CR=1 FL=1